MTYLDPTYRDVSDIAQESDEGRFVFLASRQPVPLRTEVAEEGPVPDEAVPVDVYRRDTGSRIGQFAAAGDALDRLRGLFQEPRRLGMGCREEEPGLVGQLVALVPVSELTDLFEPDSEGSEEAWRRSLPEPPELGTREPRPGLESDAAPAGEGSEADDRMKFGALHLGSVVRFESDRSHPGHFVEEATDLFETAVEGDLPPVSERLLHELGAASRDD